MIRDALHEFQLGARKQAPVLLLALYIQAFLRAVKPADHSAAVIFLDFQSAYYRVIRELAVGNIEEGSDRAVTYIFKAFGLQPEDMEAFRKTIHDGGMFGDAGMRGPLRHLAKDMLFRSWFVTRHGTHERVHVTAPGRVPAGPTSCMPLSTDSWRCSTRWPPRKGSSLPSGRTWSMDSCCFWPSSSWRKLGIIRACRFTWQFWICAGPLT